MTNYEFGDVLLIPFPFTDQTTSKKRPAVVVSSDDYHRHRDDLVLIAVTSQSRTSKSFEEMVVLEWKKAGLLKPSVVKPVLATVEKSLVLRTLGRLAEQDRKNLRMFLQKILG
ncbi:MAG TPA: type II toxin-antitoxin system PemK/MazF family toxin [Vicinamibacteria bacterium]|nr:type II toxin-antitoxin system PemK/MazF family toxin [Vicinamibacteria bacterium]